MSAAGEPLVMDGDVLIARPPAVAASTAPAAPLSSEAREEVSRAVSNGLKLAASLVLTWGIAVGVRVIIPRYLGPETFGRYQFADSFTTLLLLFTGFGFETYLKREVSRRVELAREVTAGLLLFRAALSVVLLAGALLVFARLGRPAQVLWLVLVLGLQTAVLMTNALLATLLQAKGRIDGLAVANVAAKVLWGVGIAASLAAGAGVYGVAAAMLAAEVVRSGMLFRLAHRHLGLALSVDRRASVAVLAGALPFFVNELAFTANAKLDVTILSFVSGDREVGWYGAASTISGLSMLLTPILFSVLLPMLSRAAARSDDEVAVLGRRAMEYIVVVSMAVSLLMGVGARPVVGLLFGAEFAPAAPSLAVLALSFVLTYVAIMGNAVLITLGRGWTMTRISLFSLLVTPFLHLALIPRGAALLGPGGAGAGAAAATVLSELVIVWLTLAYSRHYLFDRRVLRVLASTVAVAAASAALAAVLPLPAPARLAAALLAYAGGVLVTGAMKPDEIMQFVQGALARRRESRVASA